MAEKSLLGRITAQILPSLEDKPGAALWYLLTCHLVGGIALAGCLFAPDLQIWFIALAVLAFLAALAGALLFSRMLREVAGRVSRDIEALFAASASGEMQLFLPASEPETQTGRLLRKHFSEFLARIRQLVEEIRKIGINIAVDAARMSGSVSATAGKADRQREISHEVALASGESSSAVSEVSGSTQYVADQTANNLEMVRDSFAELREVRQKIQQISESLEDFRKTVGELGQSSASILKVVSAIDEIAEQTNLLSLNATIEAARAGVHGKGFAVVAEEVRELAKRVKPATTEISQNVNAMIAIVEKTELGTEQIHSSTLETNEAIIRTTANFDAMMQDLEQTNGQLMKIAAAIEELSTTNSEITGKVEGIDSLCLEIASAMEDSRGSVETLGGVTESMLEMVSRFRTGEGSFDRLIDWAVRSREEVVAEMEKLHRRGVNIFDSSYREIPNTNPQKYETSYTSGLQKAMQAHFDNLKKQMEGTIYALVVDRNGYLPLHHSEFSKPPTGNAQQDLLYSRHMRIFLSNRPEKRRCSHTQPMLLQTYARDTGEILNDLSLPIFIGGRHWGSFIVGLRPENFA